MESLISQLKELDFVYKVSVHNCQKILNYNAKAIVDGYRVTPPGVLANAGFTGQGQTGIILDNGANTDSCLLGAQDAPDEFDPSKRKFVLYSKRFRDDNVIDHGTHVCGSFAGQPYKDDLPDVITQYSGVAPDAKIYFYAAGVDPDGINPPYQFSETYLQPALQQIGKASVSSNSWGSTDPSGYTSFTTQIDNAAIRLPNATIYFAVGNAGYQGTPFLAQEAIAKNIITVGATYNQPFQLQQYCDDNPIGGCNLIDQVFPNNNSIAMAPFSSSGNGYSGFIAPTIVAPGFGVISASPTNDCPDNVDNLYNEAGTSMSCPIAAGLGALINQWYESKGVAAINVLTIPTQLVLSGQLAQVSLSVPLLQGTSETYVINTFNDTWPSVWSGFGTAGVHSYLLTENKLGYDNYVFNRYEYLEYKLNVTQGDRVAVALFWTDAPCFIESNQTLIVNDLDLILVTPDNQTYFGNNAPPTTSLWRDTANNKEMVYIDNAPGGEYTVYVNPIVLSTGMIHAGVAASHNLTNRVIHTDKLIFGDCDTQVGPYCDITPISEDDTIYVHGRTRACVNITHDYNARVNVGFVNGFDTKVFPGLTVTGTPLYWLFAGDRTVSPTTFFWRSNGPVDNLSSEVTSLAGERYLIVDFWDKFTNGTLKVSVIRDDSLTFTIT